MKLQFVTDTLLSILDLTTIGGSDKRTQEDKIGAFNSGSKYAIALLLRENVDIKIEVYKECDISDSDSQSILNEYTFSKSFNKDEFTDKEKEVITIDWVETPCGNSKHEPWGSQASGVIETAFSTQLGFDWELWMAFRELVSNTIDEKGKWFTDTNYSCDTNGTIITLEFPDDSEFADIVRNQDKIVLNENLFKYDLGKGLKIYENPSNHLRIYKQGILIHEDVDIISKYSFNIAFGEIDERRLLKDAFDAGARIYDILRETKNEDFLKEIITCEPFFDDKDFLNKFTEYFTSSDTINNIVTEIYENCNEVYSLKGLMDGIKKRGDCVIPGRILKTIGDSVYAYNKPVSVNSSVYDTHFEGCKVKSINEEIEEMYDFKVDVQIKKAELFGGKVIADNYNKCLILADDFNPKEDFAEFLVQYYLFKEKNCNIIEVLSQKLSEKLKK